MNLSETSSFSAILAFSAHEMKNSLSTISELIRNFRSQDLYNDSKELGQLEFETNRVNNMLMQLLILYRINETQFSPSIDEYFAYDIIKEVEAQQFRLFSIKGLTLTIDCPDDLICYCDHTLISNVLSTVVNNAQRYARKQVLLSANRENGYVCFHIEDDGEGYPAHLLNTNTLNNTDVNLNSGSTGLGLFFAATIAKMHTNSHKKGFITLENHSPLGGSKFSLFLP